MKNLIAAVTALAFSILPAVAWSIGGEGTITAHNYIADDSLTTTTASRQQIIKLTQGLDSLGLLDDMVEMWVAGSAYNADDSLLGLKSAYPGTFENTPVSGTTGLVFVKSDSDAVNTALQIDPLGDAGQFTIGIAVIKGDNIAINDKWIGGEKSGATTGSGMIAVGSTNTNEIAFRTSFQNGFIFAQAPVGVDRGFVVGTMSGSSASLYLDGAPYPIAVESGTGTYASAIPTAESVVRIARRFNSTTYADMTASFAFVASRAFTGDEIKSIYSLLLDSVLAGQAFADTRSDGQLRNTLRVGELNAEFFNQATPTEVAEALASYKFDAICLTEVPIPNFTLTGSADGLYGDHVSVIAALMGYDYQARGVIDVADDTRKRVAILSRWPLTDIAETDLTGTGTGTFTSACIAATLTKHGKEWRVYSAHVDGADGAGTSIRNLRTTLNADSGLVVIGADFNHDPDHAEMVLFEGDGWEFIWDQLGVDTAPLKTYRSYDSLDNGVIDNIMFRSNSGITVGDGGILDLDPYISDHKPIWAELRAP